MKTWLKNMYFKFFFQKIRNRFLFFMIILSVPPLFILGYFSFHIAKGTLLTTNKQANQDHMRTSSEVADLIFRNIINLNQAIIFNDQIRNEIRVHTTENNNHLDRKVETVNLMQNVINSNFIDSQFVSSICIFDVNYQAYCIGRSDDAGIYEGSKKSQLIESSDWYRQLVKAQGRVVFLHHNVLGDSKDSFSTVKLFRDSGSIEGKPIGLLIVNVSKSIFNKIFEENNKYKGNYLAIDDSTDPARFVYAMNKTPVGSSLMQDVKSNFAKWKSEGYLVIHYRNETTNWIFVHLIKEQELLKQSNNIGLITIIMATSISLIALLLSYVISGSITRPLLQLKKMMLDWTRGNRVLNQPFQNDEVGVIGETFKHVAYENENLNRRLVHSELKEREAELKALQAQIKPHFLYNTLDSIYWMAIMGNSQKVAQMAVSLSESFKLSLNKGKETLPVFKELQHIEHYMVILNIRYNNRFTYIQDVDSSIMTIEILKLILQPLVENAIYHGLEPKVGEGKVTIIGIKENEFLCFVVEDDGVGIENVDKVEKGYGLQNVSERLMLYYGPSSSLTISSQKNIGTRVEIRFNPNSNGGEDHA